MAIKKLVEVWDGKNIIENNIEFLKQKTREIHLPINDTNKNILRDLLDTYKKTPCAGIAANQIGYDKRIFIGMKEDEPDTEEQYKELRKDEPQEQKKESENPNADNYEFYINPQIDQTYKKSIQEEEEGCLSIPEIRLVAERYDKIKIRYYDINGKKIKKTLKGFLSRLFQHELDHLDGKLMVENRKIKKVYRISDNDNINSLYTNLVDELSKF
ncbi:peptide deformylase [Candidatus Marinimicrobia bacterium]|nr:peptide deformylase [Candidatus Neomarinimicrobiota bacterium]